VQATTCAVTAFSTLLLLSSSSGFLCFSLLFTALFFTYSAFRSGFFAAVANLRTLQVSILYGCFLVPSSKYSCCVASQLVLSLSFLALSFLSLPLFSPFFVILHWAFLRCRVATRIHRSICMCACHFSSSFQYVCFCFSSPFQVEFHRTTSPYFKHNSKERNVVHISECVVVEPRTKKKKTEEKGAETSSAV
jgi:hypothetical protein